MLIGTKIISLFTSPSIRNKLMKVHYYFFHLSLTQNEIFELETNHGYFLIYKYMQLSVVSRLKNEYFVELIGIAWNGTTES